MNELTEATPAPTDNRAFRARIVWFFAGAGVNYLLISTPFKYLSAHTAMPVWEKSALSLAVSTCFFFLWNYFINFRTDARKRDALKRYLIAVASMWVLQSATLTLFKHFDAHLALNFGRSPLDLDILATQFLFSGIKFILYHKWVFPLPKA